jgi:hypothetical protein
VNGPGLEIRDSYSSMLGKNSLDSSWLMLLLYEGRCSSRSHRCEWKNGRNDSVYIMILFLCRMLSNDTIAMETVCLWTIDVCYCDGYVPLVVTMCH